MPLLHVVASWPVLLSLLALVALPWLASIVAAMAQGLAHRALFRHEGRSLSHPARRWLDALAQRNGMKTRIEVHAGLVEAYFPHADTVGLSPAAAESSHPVHRAIVAHELGHAATASSHPALRALLPAARLAVDGLPYAVTAALITGALVHSPVLLALAGLLTLANVLAHATVVGDEAIASWRARAWLVADPELTAEDRRACGKAMNIALGAYAAPAVTWLILLAASPAIAVLALSGAPMPHAEPLDATGTWLLLFLGPTLLLHAGLVIAETLRPDPVRTAFQLELRQQRQHQWGFMAGICALVIALGVAGWSDGLHFYIALALAVFVGLEPASVLVRAIVFIPLLVLARPLGLADNLEDALSGPAIDGDRAPPKALASLWENPPWFLRGARLLQLAWLPLLSIILVEAWMRVA